MAQDMGNDSVAERIEKKVLALEASQVIQRKSYFEDGDLDIQQGDDVAEETAIEAFVATPASEETEGEVVSDMDVDEEAVC